MDMDPAQIVRHRTKPQPSFSYNHIPLSACKANATTQIANGILHLRKSRPAAAMDTLGHALLHRLKHGNFMPLLCEMLIFRVGREACANSDSTVTYPERDSVAPRIELHDKCPDALYAGRRKGFGVLNEVIHEFGHEYLDAGDIDGHFVIIQNFRNLFCHVIGKGWAGYDIHEITNRGRSDQSVRPLRAIGGTQVQTLKEILPHQESMDLVAPGPAKSDVTALAIPQAHEHAQVNQREGLNPFD
ncbi:MAG: hypothetical protein ACHQ9S_14175 [Candidatus Binatia bacterium]